MHSNSRHWIQLATIALVGILCWSNVYGGDFAVIFEKAYQARLAKDYKGALQGYRTLVKKVNLTTGGVPSRIWFEIGGCERKIGSHEKAVEALQKAIDTNTCNQEIWVWSSRLMMARSLEDLGRSDEASAILNGCEKELETANKEAENWRFETLNTTRQLIEAARRSKETNQPDKSEQATPRKPSD